MTTFAGESFLYYTMTRNTTTQEQGTIISVL